MGAVTYSVLTVGFLLWNGQSAYFPALLFGMLTYGVVSGIVLGYIAGVMVGGVFLAADKLRNLLARYSRSPKLAADENPFTAAS